MTKPRTQRKKPIKVKNELYRMEVGSMLRDYNFDESEEQNYLKTMAGYLLNKNHYGFYTTSQAPNSWSAELVKDTKPELGDLPPRSLYITKDGVAFWKLSNGNFETTGIRK